MKIFRGTFPVPLGPCVLAIGFCLAGSGVSGPVSGGESNGPPPFKFLTQEESVRWHEQGLDRPATHLLNQAEERAAGGVTTLHAAVILVQFPDLPADQVTHSREYYETLLFSRGVLPGLSVAEYLEASSNGRLILTGQVRGWFTVSENRNFYTNRTAGIGWYPQNAQRLVEEAIYEADPTINFASFDTEGPDGVADSGDDDELIDGLIVVHAGPGREGGGSTINDFASLQWWIPQPFPADGVFGKFFTLNSEDGEIGLFLHELGHLLGLPDLYDTDGGSFGTGRWSMMSGGFLIDEGRLPADFDGWSKSKLGFVDVQTILANRKDLLLPPVDESGKVYRLWQPGVSGPEYFLLENRRRQGLDAGLPGEGLLLYHVDETINTNRTPNHYRVAVEQADGLFQLENRFNDPSIGDDGDPYHAGQIFGRYTVPSSQAYDGTDSDVSVYNIRGPDVDGAYLVDLSVETGPVVELQTLTLVELAGNGDGLLQAGETAGLFPEISIERRPATGVRIHFESLEPLATLIDTDLDIGGLPVGARYTPVDPIRVLIGSPAPSDPYGVHLQATLTWDDAPARTIPIEVGIGTLVGRNDTFDTLPQGWFHEAVRPTAYDQWSYGTNLGVDGSGGFRHAFVSGGYLRNTDAVLVSPPVLLPPHAALLFDQAVEIINPDSTKTQAGGLIEISVNGADWQTAIPDGGYPRHFQGNHLDWIGRPMFSGRMGVGFHPVRVDLSAYSGSIRVRFRFFSEVEFRAGDGWRIDNVRLTSDFTPVRVLSVRSEVEGPDVALVWELAEPLPSAIRWVRGEDPASATPVGEGWIPAAEHGRLVDPGIAERLPATYWLESLERDGSRDRWGPYRVQTVGGNGPAWTVAGNPTRGISRFAWSGVLPADAALEIFDVSGRLVYRARLAAAPGWVAWEGRDQQGRTVGPGIYFARVRNTSFTPIRLVRLP